MNIALTWDLLVVIFFAIVCAYSFIVGKHESVKIIIATYIAIVAIQGMGNLIAQFAVYSKSYVDMLGWGFTPEIFSVIKLGAFVALIIFLAIRGGFEMEYNKDLGTVLESGIVGAFGFSTAGLLLSTLLTYISGRPLLDPTLATAAPLAPILSGSQLMQFMVDYQNLWFALPALLLMAVGFFSRDAE